MRTRPALAWSPGAAGPLLAADFSWQDSALCAETDPEAFFPDRGEPAAAAKRICRACDVRAECLEYALETGQRDGVWGGMSAEERSRLGRAPSRPLLSRCANGLHVMTGANTLPDGRCRTCARTHRRRREGARAARKALAA